MKLSADQAIADVRAALTGLPVFIAGSSVGAAMYAHISDEAYDDVDVFCASINALVTSVNKLEAQGFEMNDRFKRVFHRWMKYGTKSWHTNSIKLTHPLSGVEVNVVYKLVDGHATTSLAQVIESFDFGLLAIGGVDCLTDTDRDMRGYLFPANIHTADLEHGRLPLMPNKRQDWRQGFISEYNGLRMVGRYAKYHGYGYDMRYIKDDLVTGYREASIYLATRDDDPDKLTLGSIYKVLKDSILADDFASLKEAGEELIMLDSLDQIYEKLQ